MEKYSLAINFSTEDVRQINLIGQFITIVKKFKNELEPSNLVSWVVFKPFEMNKVTWSENYGVYASTILTEAGAVIHKSSIVNNAISNQLYIFENGTFNPPIEGERGSYRIQNESQPYSPLTFGLTQGVTVNGSQFTANPLNAVTVLPQEKASFKPIEKIRIFLHQKLDNGTIISDIRSTPLDIDLTKVHNQTIKYSNGNGTFVLC